MPEMDGFELMGRLTARSDLGVILMTGSTDERDSRPVRAIRERAFFFLAKPFEREVLLTLVERCLEVRRLDAENQRHLSRLRRELQAALIFQQSLLPARAVTRNGLDITLDYEPCGELCGDFCDYVLDDHAPCALILTDVSGHGAPAAMLTGIIKQVFHDTALEQHAPGVVLQRIVAASLHFPLDKHLTGVCVRIHRGSNTLEFVNAGHPPGLLVRPDGEIVRLDSSAPLVHPVLPDWHGEQRVEPMRPGDQVLLYTDGLTEACNPDGEEFGIERLVAVTRGLANCSTAVTGPERIALLRAEVAAFTAGRPREDDLTIVLIRRL